MAAWIDDLNARLSARSETFELRPHQGQLLASVKPGEDRDLDWVVKACEQLRADRPELVVELNDDVGSDLLPPTPEPMTPGVSTMVRSEAESVPEVDWSPPPHRTIKGSLSIGRREPSPETPHIQKVQSSPDGISIGFGRSTPAVLAANVLLIAYDAQGAEVGQRRMEHWTDHLINPDFNPRIGVLNYTPFQWERVPVRYEIEARFGIAVPIAGTVEATRRGANWTLEVAPEFTDAILYTAVLATFADAAGNSIAEIVFPGRDMHPYRRPWTSKQRVPKARSVQTSLLGAVLMGEPQRLTCTFDDA